ncbi:MAG: chemotaxis protein CheX [Saezia sp.]
MNEIDEGELRLFVDSVRNYFKKTTKKEPTITAAYLGTDSITTYEYNGIVSFSGSYSGQIIVSMPRQLLISLLVMLNETDVSDDNLLDIVGEIANTLAGNARKSLDDGAGLNISVPVKLKSSASARARVRKHPYVIDLSWVGCPALVCVDIAKTND